MRVAAPTSRRHTDADALVRLTTVGRKKREGLMNRDAISKLRSEKDDHAFLGSYNAYYHKGENFKSILPGAPATVSHTATEIIVKTLVNDDILSLSFPKESSEILWVGFSGRTKDYLTWLLFKGPETSCLISNFMAEYDMSTEEYASELYHSLANLGFKTSIEKKHRGLFVQVVTTICIIAISISLFSSNNIMFGILSLTLVMVFILLEVFTKKGPLKKKWK